MCGGTTAAGKSDKTRQRKQKDKTRQELYACVLRVLYGPEKSDKTNKNKKGLIKDTKTRSHAKHKGWSTKRTLTHKRERQDKAKDKTRLDKNFMSVSFVSCARRKRVTRQDKRNKKTRLDKNFMSPLWSCLIFGNFETFLYTHTDKTRQEGAHKGHEQTNGTVSKLLLHR